MKKEKVINHIKQYLFRILLPLDLESLRLDEFWYVKVEEGGYFMLTRNPLFFVRHFDNFDTMIRVMSVGKGWCRIDTLPASK